MDIESVTEVDFRALPLVIEGESKEIRYAGRGTVLIRFKPTIYSYTANRSGVVAGSDRLRLRATKVLLEVLQLAGIRHAYRKVTDQWVLSDLLMPSEVEYEKYGLKPFRPADLTEEQILHLPKAPPIEVIVKQFHSGTSKHRYRGMARAPVRSSHPVFAGVSFGPEDAYPKPIVRFDWRNPLRDAQGNRVPDEILPEDMADWYIDVTRARRTALRAYDALSSFLNLRNIVLYDLCLFIAEDGETVYGEVSQDCGRFRHFDLGHLDKDVWRSGGSSDEVIKKYELLLKLIEGQGEELR